MNKSTVESRERRLRLKALGLCVWCGKNKPVFGYVHCQKCKDYMKRYIRKYRERLSQQRFDSVIDSGLISVKEAAVILHVSTKTIHSFIDRGWLKVRDTVDHAFYVYQFEVAVLSAKRSLLKCLKCGRVWTKRSINGNTNRCYIRDCRSTNVIVLQRKNFKVKRNYDLQ